MKLLSLFSYSRLVCFVAALSVVSCAENAEQYHQHSELHFKHMGTNKGCGLTQARAETFNVCIRGNVDSKYVKRAEGFLERSLLTWMRALKQIDDKVTGNISFSCEKKAHLNITLRPGNGTSFAGCRRGGGRSTIYVGKSYGTTLHEMGHAFAGLADTYSGRSAGNCQPGQPASIMCWGAYGPNKDAKGFSLLWEDDVKGIQARYRRIFTDLTPHPEKLDLLGSIDVKNPWSGFAGEKTPESNSIYVKLVKENDFSTEQRVFVSVPKSENALYVCNSNSGVECISQSQNLLGVTKIGSKQSVDLYALNEKIDPAFVRNLSFLAGFIEIKTLLHE